MIAAAIYCVLCIEIGFALCEWQRRRDAARDPEYVNHPSAVGMLIVSGVVSGVIVAVAIPMIIITAICFAVCPPGLSRSLA